MQCALYCHLWPARSYYIFPHYLINGSILEKEMFLNIKSLFRFYLQLLSEAFLIIIIIIIQRDVIIRADRASCKEPLFLSDFEET